MKFATLIKFHFFLLFPFLVPPAKNEILIDWIVIRSFLFISPSAEEKESTVTLQAEILEAMRHLA